MRKKYKPLSEFVLKNIRQNHYLEENDTSMDDEFNNEVDRKRLFRSYMNWLGIIGYEDKIIKAIEDIYDVKIESEVKNE